MKMNIVIDLSTTEALEKFVKLYESSIKKFIIWFIEDKSSIKLLFAESQHTHDSVIENLCNGLPVNKIFISDTISFQEEMRCEQIAVCIDQNTVENIKHNLHRIFIWGDQSDYGPGRQICYVSNWLDIYFLTKKIH